MKLYDLTPSPYCARVRMQIYAKGLNVEIVRPNWPPDAAYRRLTGTGKVPALVVDGDILVESTAICEYLEDRGEGPSLRPVSPLERGPMRMMMALTGSHLTPPVQSLVPLLLARRFEGQEVGPALNDMRHALHLVERFLAGGRHAVAGQLTLADCTLLPMLFYVKFLAPLYGWPDPLRDRPKTAKYYRLAGEEPAAAKMLGELAASLAKAPRP
jgi:glutathione S-transferase